MKQIVFGDSLKLPQTIVGCMRLKDSGMRGKELLRFVEECLDLELTAFDHAPVYGGYECEKIFGEAVLKKRPELRSKMQIVTKAGIVLPGAENNQVIYYNSSKKKIIEEVENSLKRLETEFVDLLLVHRPDPLADPAETAEALEQLVREGKALHVGVSNFTPSQISMLQSYMSIPLVTNQVELSVKSVENFFNGILDDAFIRRIPLMAWSPLGGGSVFTGTDEQAVRLRDVVGQIAKERGTAMDAIMYAWLYVHPVRIAAIMGTMNMSRMKTAVEGQSIALSYDEWYRILAASRGFDVP